jgi:hypothetical protein
VVAGIALFVLVLVVGAATSSSFETSTDISNATGLGLVLAALPQWRRMRALSKES